MDAESENTLRMKKRSDTPYILEDGRNSFRFWSANKVQVDAEIG